ncbi:MAG: fluoride efflux transporter CrcB [Megasphaera sp.]|nr:fluoride efflux transporter CrcB [Megasphaera sp.]
MEKIIFIALGGGIGSALRYGITQLTLRYGAVSLPYGTILANTIGSFCIGLLFVFITQMSNLPQTVKLFFFFCILGSFTTFSTYNMELLTLVRTGDILSAAAYFSLNVVGGFLCCWLGFAVGNALWQ